MGERITVGGIKNNPAIDKINELDEIDASDYAVRLMEQLLVEGDRDGSSGVNWGGKEQDYGNIPLHFPIERIK
ncbi:MAG: hypothetical protein LBV33_03920 [Lachnospiraceae bacterium]|jgi:hypothetical protein|nr:hypothetical protein [Lachnospiraceae bacterium]